MHGNEVLSLARSRIRVLDGKMALTCCSFGAIAPRGRPGFT
jgi:hypothetical protein